MMRTGMARLERGYAMVRGLRREARRRVLAVLTYLRR